MPSAGAAGIFRKPIFRLRRHIETNRRMRNIETGTEARECCGVLHALHDLRGTAEERPLARKLVEQGGPLLETRAADKSDRRLLGGLRQV